MPVLERPKRRVADPALVLRGERASPSHVAGDAPGRKDGNRGGVRGARGARVARALFVIVNVQHENEALRVDAEGEIVRDEVRQRRELFGRADARVQKHRRALISGA